jgi:hypothetical protein
MERSLAGRPPRVVFLRLPDTGNAIEPDAQLPSLLGRAGIDGRKRDPHDAVPDLGLRIDAGGNGHPRIPCRPGLLLRILAIDIEVYPFTLRGHLELFVARDVLEVGADERLRDVPGPQARRMDRCRAGRDAPWSTASGFLSVIRESARRSSRDQPSRAARAPRSRYPDSYRAGNRRPRMCSKERTTGSSRTPSTQRAPRAQSAAASVILIRGTIVPRTPHAVARNGSFAPPILAVRGLKRVPAYPPEVHD